jgi:hypothetical protein
MSQSIASRQGEPVERGFYLQFDLFGLVDVRIPKPCPSVRVRTRRRAFIPKGSADLTLDLFEFSNIPGWNLPPHLQEVEDEEEIDVDIPYVPSGNIFVQTHQGLKWSREGIIDLQIHLFHRSMEELGNKNNDLDRWSTLRWIFAPAIQHIWHKNQEGKIVAEVIHERSSPFSYHNCAIAARVDAEALREGIRRNLAPEVMMAIERVVSH